MTTFIVTTNLDEMDTDATAANPGGTGLSLREAIALANAAPNVLPGQPIGSVVPRDTIEFDPQVFTGGAESLIRLTLGELKITEAVEINGSTATDVIVTGDSAGNDALRPGTWLTDAKASFGGGADASDYSLADNNRVFHIDATGNTTLNGLTVTGGAADEGGGIYAENPSRTLQSRLELIETVVAGNSALAGPGGGILSRQSETVIERSAIDGNAVQAAAEVDLAPGFGPPPEMLFGLGGGGGGIAIVGETLRRAPDLEITSSTISNNSIPEQFVPGLAPTLDELYIGGGGGIGVASGIVKLTNTTIADNEGAGLFLGAGQADVNFSTISGNTGHGLLGGNPLRDASFPFPTRFLPDSSIILGNVLGEIAALPGATSVEAVTGSARIWFFSGFEANEIFAQTKKVGERDGTDVFAGVLADNGGPVETISLLPKFGNPALDVRRVSDVVRPDDLSTDANGNPREVNILSITDLDGPADAGAVEVQIGGPPIIVDTAADIVDPDDGKTSLREAIALSNTQVDLNTIAFDPTVFTGGAASLIRLTAGELTIVEAVTIDGSTGSDVTITGDADGDDVLVPGGFLTDVDASRGNTSGGTGGPLDDNSRIFQIDLTDSRETTVLSGLTLTGGHTTADGATGGGINVLDGALILTDMAIAGNSTAGSQAGGGGLFIAGGQSLTVIGSEVTGNRTLGADSGGGGILAEDVGTGGGNGGTVPSTGDSSCSDNSGCQNTPVQAAGEDILILETTIADNSTIGSNSPGGGLSQTTGGDTTIETSVVNDNSTGGDSSSGGGLYSTGLVRIETSTLSGNQTFGQSSDGGGVTSGNLRLDQATVTGNAVLGLLADGAAVSIIGDENNGIVNSIVVGNADPVLFLPPNSTINVQFDGFILRPDATVPNVRGSIVDGDATEIFAETEIKNGLAAGILGANGGPVQTVALLADLANPALDIAPVFASTPATDATGAPRSIDLPGVDNGGTTDAGAVELQGFFVAPTATPDQFTVQEGGPAAIIGNLLANDVPSPTSGTITVSGLRNSDGDDLPIDTEVALPGLGSLTLADDGQLTFAAQTDIDGLGEGDALTLSFTYEIIESQNGQTSISTFEITVEGIDDASEPHLIEGTDEDDKLTGTGEANVINGKAGNDRILGFAGDDTLNGDAGDDSIFGGEGNDLINGGDGADELVGYLGDDILNGELGNDILRGRQGNDLMDGGDGDDTMFGGNGNDTLRGGTGNDLLDGGGGGDILDGEGGNDTVVGGSEADTLLGGAGNDILRGEGNNDLLNGEAGNDLMFGSSGEDTLLGGNGNDILEGNAQADDLFGQDGNDTLRGGDGFDFLDGGTGNDTLNGGNGNDVLVGGLGVDLLLGGAQNDVFRFLSDLESNINAEDVITDIEGVGTVGGDLVDLSAIDADLQAAGNQTFTFLGAVSSVVGLGFGAGALWVENFEGQTRIFGNIDNDGTIEFALKINDGASFAAADYTAADFIL